MIKPKLTKIDSNAFAKVNNLKGIKIPTETATQPQKDTATTEQPKPLIYGVTGASQDLTINTNPINDGETGKTIHYGEQMPKEIKMKIPKYIRISGIDYEIQESEHLHSEERILYGQADYAKSVIRLNEGNQNHQYKSVTLWHEILHSIAHHANLDLGKNTEKIVDVLAFGIYQVLQDNAKKLFDIQ